MTAGKSDCGARLVWDEVAVCEKHGIRCPLPAPALDVERLREAAQAAAFALDFHNKTPTGRRRSCDPKCIACAAIAALRAALATGDEEEGHTDDPATHDPRCIAVSRWHVGECYLPQPAPDALRAAAQAVFDLWDDGDLDPGDGMYKACLDAFENLRAALATEEKQPDDTRLEDGPPVPGGVTAIRGGKYVTERKP